MQNRFPRPLPITVFSLLLLVSALFMAFLGMTASACFLPAPVLAFCGGLLWTARLPRLFKALLLVNLATGAVLVGTIAYRNLMLPMETITLSLSGIAMVGNLLVGGPLLSLFAIPLLMLPASRRF